MGRYQLGTAAAKQSGGGEEAGDRLCRSQAGMEEDTEELGEAARVEGHKIPMDRHQQRG